MAMTKCKECGAEISTTAKACPHCGAKQRRTSLLTMALAVVLIPSCIAGIWTSTTNSDKRAQDQRAAEAAKSPEQRAAEQTRKAAEEAEFQRAVVAAKTVKSGMKNPASFELSGAGVTPKGAICLQYRGTNSFNAVVPGYAVLAPNAAAVLAGSERDVAAAWNQHCAKQSMRDISYLKHAL